MEKQGIVKRLRIARRGGPYTVTEKGKAWVLERLEAMEHLFLEWRQYSTSLVKRDESGKSLTM
jgi:DNA-binding PadR family transcriptional regulator